METKKIYMRFLNLLHAIEGGENAPEMDLEAKKLLEVIAVQESNKTPLTVTAAMNLGHIASPATIHRKLDVLRELGMIDTVYDATTDAPNIWCPPKPPTIILNRWARP